MRRAVERQRRRAQDLIAVARELRRRRPRRRRGRRACAGRRPPPRARCRPRRAPASRAPSRSFELRRGARGVHPQLPDARAGELRQRRRAARRRGGRQRDERVRGAMPAARRPGVGQIVDRALERRDRVGRRRRRRPADRARTARRACRDRRWRPAPRRRSRRRCARAGCAAPRAARSANRRRGPAVRTLCRSAAGTCGAAAAAARIASRRTCASGSCAARAERLAVDRGGRRQRFERQPADARAGRPLRRVIGDRQPPQQRERVGAGRAQLALRSRTSASRPCATPSRSVTVSARAGDLDQRPLRRLGLRRADVRQPADRLADRRADVGLGFDLQARGERRRAPRRARTRPAPCRAFQPCAACPMALAASARISGSAWRSDGQEVGNERGALEAAERAHGDADRLRVAAVEAGADDREIARRRRAAILGLEHGEPRRARRRGRLVLRAATTTKKKPQRTQSTQRNIFFAMLRDLRGSFIVSCRRWRVAAEYSSICARQIERIGDRDVGDLARPSSVTASSRGITKPV